MVSYIFLMIISSLILGNAISLPYYVYGQNASTILPSMEIGDDYLPPATIIFQIDSLISKMHEDIDNSLLILEPTNYTEAEHVTVILEDMNSTLNLIDRKIGNYVWQISNEGH